MAKQATILIADDDAGHARLVGKNLQRAGLQNQVLRFKDGQEILDFLLQRGNGAKRADDSPYFLLLDIAMPKVDGVEVLRQIKQHSELRKMPVVMLTTTDEPREIERCHALGCSNYVVKPLDYDAFAEAIKRLANFVQIVKVPDLHVTAQSL